MSSATLKSVPELIRIIGDSLDEIGERPDEIALEHLAISIYSAMTGPARLFHTIRHIFDLLPGLNATQTLAAIFHDIVYYQVDEALPPRIRSYVAPWITAEGPAHINLPQAGEGPWWVDMVNGVFGVSTPQHFADGPGFNEYASALTAAAMSHPHLSPQALLGIIVCIEGTIPFRLNDTTEQSWMFKLGQRITQVGAQQTLALSEPQIDALIQQAVGLANNDVHSFGATDPGAFLDNTWMLLAEGKAILRQPELYNIRDYREGLSEMEAFLRNLEASRVFSSYKNQPASDELSELRQRAASNIRLSVHYLNAKIYTVALIEAAAIATGGDLPLSLLMGALPDVDHSVERIAESIAGSTLEPCDTIDPDLDALFERGHAYATDFDLKRSPVSALLYRHLGTAKIEASVASARSFLDGKESPQDFLARQPAEVVKVVLGLLKALAVVRNDRFAALLNTMD